MKPYRYPAKGFSLIDVTIALVVAAILCALALPSYNGAVRKTRRVEGKTLLNAVMAMEERYYDRNNRYTEDILVESEQGASSASGYYIVSDVHVDDAAQFVRIRVRPVGSQTVDSCGELGLDSLGRREAAEASCW